MNPAKLEMSDREFRRVQQFLENVCGIALSDSKRTLVLARLSNSVRRLGLRSFDAYLDLLESPLAEPTEARVFVNALTTNLTRFWREEHHFEDLVARLPALMAARSSAARARPPRLRFWSAGCSTGQEPYSLAMSLLAVAPELRGWDIRILATDIDTDVLSRAPEGIFPTTELAGLSSAKAALFERIDHTHVRVPEPARRLVTFKPLNLLADWPMRGPFDAIFCRNVAIYFAQQTQRQLFARLGTMIAPDGYLYIGHSETMGDSRTFRMVGKTVYQLKDAAGRRAA